MHHLDSTTGETEGHRPQGALAGPIGDLVKCGTTRQCQDDQAFSMHARKRCGTRTGHIALHPLSFPGSARAPPFEPFQMQSKAVRTAPDARVLSLI